MRKTPIFHHLIQSRWCFLLLAASPSTWMQSLSSMEITLHYSFIISSISLPPKRHLRLRHRCRIMRSYIVVADLKKWKVCFVLVWVAESFHALHTKSDSFRLNASFIDSQKWKQIARYAIILQIFLLWLNRFKSAINSVRGTWWWNRCFCFELNRLWKMFKHFQVIDIIHFIFIVTSFPRENYWKILLL